MRQIDPFLRFLEVAAQCNGDIINNSEIGRDCQVEPKTVARYFQILEDTLLGYFLPSLDLSVRKQQRQAAKFYFFDPGVVKALRGTLTIPVTPSTYGLSTEQAQKLERFLDSIPEASAMMLSLEQEYRRLGKIDVYPW